HAVRFAINLQLRVADHVEQHAALVAMGRRAGLVLAGKMLAPQEKWIAGLVVDQLFAVEKGKINAIRGLKLGHMLGQLAEQRRAAGTIVSAQENTAAVDRIFIGKRPSIVMRTQ